MKNNYSNYYNKALQYKMSDSTYNQHLNRIAEEHNPEQRNYHIKNLVGSLLNEDHPLSNLLLNHLNVYKHENLPYSNDELQNPSITRRLEIDPHTKVMFDSKTTNNGETLPFAHLQLHYKSPQQNLLDKPIVTIPIPFTKNNLHDFLDKFQDHPKYSQLKHWAIRTFGDKNRNDDV